MTIQMRLRQLLVALAAIGLIAACGNDDLTVDDPSDDAVDDTRPPTDPGPDTGTALVLASEEGVVLVAERDEDDSVTEVSHDPAAAAFGVGEGLVLYQGAASGEVYPPAPEGPVRVWSAGESRDLPVDPDAARTTLLDAGLIDGAPVALVAERFGEVQPEDTFEELVLIDVREHTRTTVVRRPAWESAHTAAALLPDGDVVGLVSSEGEVTSSRWSQDRDEAVWTVELGFDATVQLAVLDETIALVESSFDQDRDFAPLLTVSTHAAGTGEATTPETVEVADPDGIITTGLFCRGWLDPSTLACARSGGPPVAVSVEDGSMDELPGAPGAIPSPVRAADPGEDPAGDAGGQPGTPADEPHDATAEMRPDLMEVEPQEASAGQVVELRFPEETSRGVAFVLEEAVGDSWGLRWFLTAGSEAPGDWWAPEDAEGRGWPDVGVMGPGPDLIEVPAPATPGDYRVCTANAGEELCAPIRITG